VLLIGLLPLIITEDSSMPKDTSSSGSNESSLLGYLAAVAAKSPAPRIADPPSTPPVPRRSKPPSESFNPEISEDEGDDQEEDQISPDFIRNAAKKSKKRIDSTFDHWVEISPESLTSHLPITTFSHAPNTQSKRVLSTETVVARPKRVMTTLVAASSHVTLQVSKGKSEILSLSAYQKRNEELNRQIDAARTQRKEQAEQQRPSSVTQSIFSEWPTERAFHKELQEKLLKCFPEDEPQFWRRVQLNPPPPDAIHVFIDLSNIYIGFLSEVKRRLNIPPHGNLTENLTCFNMEAFLAILHRSRPTQRCFLSGSKSATHDKQGYLFERAEKFGYHVEVLERKSISTAKPESSQKQSEAPSALRAAANEFQPRSAPISSMKRSPDKQLAKRKEQGVDESLHTQILMSLVDFEPSTMVIATGDGAVSSFNTGFADCLERALSKGWKVEVVSWTQNLSKTYRRAPFVDYMKQGKFKIIGLDGWVDFLLGLGDEES
jgi:NYN domain